MATPAYPELPATSHAPYPKSTATSHARTCPKNQPVLARRNGNFPGPQLLPCVPHWLPDEPSELFRDHIRRDGVSPFMSVPKYH